MTHIRLFSYFGSKVRMAPQYLRPIYPTIIEPFAGAAGYSCHYWRRAVCLYDVNPLVVDAIKYLIKATPKMIRALPLLVGKEPINNLSISESEKNLIGFWATVGSHGQPAKTAHAWARDYRDQASCWGSRCRERLAVTVNKIKHWQVFNQSYESIDVNAIGPATWFVDPPYQKQGKAYKYGSKLIDYNHLGKWCQSLPGQVIVCEQLGATWLPFRPLYKITGANKDKLGGKLIRSTEVIWTKNCNEMSTLFPR